MAVEILSDELVRVLTCPVGKTHFEVFDQKVKGFYLDLLSSGRKSFRVRYWSNAKKRLETIGDASQIDVETARKVATHLIAIGKSKIWERNTSNLVAAEHSSKLIKFEDFLINKYLPYVRSYKKSWQSDKSMIQVHVIPAIGKISMARLSAQHISGFIETMKQKNLSPGTINRALVLIHYAFKCAQRWSEPGVSLESFNGMRYLKNDNRIERYLSILQSSQLLEAVRTSQNTLLPMIISFLIYTGARKREVLEAKWTDINREQKSWKISKNKSNKIRHVPLSVAAIEVLQIVKAHRQFNENCEYIFANPYTSKPFTSFFFSWDTARKRAGLPDLRVHDLRHSFASFLVNAGRSLYEVQELLGHADIKTTSRYAHLSRERLSAAVECVPKI